MASEQDSPLDPALVEFIEDFGLYWHSRGNPRMEGRVLAFLIVTNEAFVSASHLAQSLRASTGSISTTTRRLVQVGFIRSHAVPGDRNHYYRAEDDVWGSFLAGERSYLRHQANLADRALDALGEVGTPNRRRLQNMRDYMRWLESEHKRLQQHWIEYKAQSAPDQRPKTSADSGVASFDGATAAEAALGLGVRNR